MIIKYELTRDPSRWIEGVGRSKVLGTDEVLAATTGNRSSEVLNCSRIVAIAAGNTKPASAVQRLVVVADRVDGEKPTINIQLGFRYCNFLVIYNPSH